MKGEENVLCQHENVFFNSWSRKRPSLNASKVANHRTELNQRSCEDLEIKTCSTLTYNTSTLSGTVKRMTDNYDLFLSRGSLSRYSVANVLLPILFVCLRIFYVSHKEHRIFYTCS